MGPNGPSSYLPGTITVNRVDGAVNYLIDLGYVFSFEF